MSEEEQKRLFAVVEGRVQGVGFRSFVLDKAEELDLTGWVRNTRLGNVEVLAEGRRFALDEFLKALKKGPNTAYVTNVRESWSEATGEFRLFGVEYTV
ncbi:MAG: acylphosphatase [Anaerolineaceae bacterium]|nr:acylphosphatase [Anaerolineaceae bacterium]